MNKSYSKQDANEPDPELDAAHILRAFLSLRALSTPLLAHLKLHQQLAGIEWQEEKNRLLKLLFFLLFGFACFSCLLIFCGVLVVVLSWGTGFVIAMVVAFCVAYGLGVYIAWRHLLKLTAQPEKCFASTREELAADIAMIMSKVS